MRNLGIYGPTMTNPEPDCCPACGSPEVRPGSHCHPRLWVCLACGWRFEPGDAARLKEDRRTWGQSPQRVEPNNHRAARRPLSPQRVSRTPQFTHPFWLFWNG
jgi:hypothetical protein